VQPVHAQQSKKQSKIHEQRRTKKEKKNNRCPYFPARRRRRSRRRRQARSTRFVPALSVLVCDVADTPHTKRKKKKKKTDFLWVFCRRDLRRPQASCSRPWVCWIPTTKSERQTARERWRECDLDTAPTVFPLSLARSLRSAWQRAEATRRTDSRGAPRRAWTRADAK
jgi:hypothetical protein